MGPVLVRLEFASTPVRNKLDLALIILSVFTKGKSLNSDKSAKFVFRIAWNLALKGLCGYPSFSIHQEDPSSMLRSYFSLRAETN